MKAAAGLVAILLLASACERQASEAAPAPGGTASSAATPAASPVASPEAFDPAGIIGTWQPYSRGADREFGALEITSGRISFANFGSADYTLRGRYAVLTWRKYPANARELCGNAPPELVEFRLQDKSEILAAGKTGEWLEISFFATTAAIGSDRATSTQLCRISTWSR